MKNRKTNVFSMILALVLVIMLFSGCDKYRSSYKAIIYITTKTNSVGSMRFDSFEGTEVFKLKNKSENGYVSYSLTLESGEATIYYDCGDGKTELVSVSAGDDIKDRTELLKKGTIYIIVETNGKCQSGSFKFNLEYQE